MKKCIMIIALLLILASNAWGFNIVDGAGNNITDGAGNRIVDALGGDSTPTNNNINSIFFFFIGDANHEKMDYYILSVNVGCTGLVG